MSAFGPGTPTAVVVLGLLGTGLAAHPAVGQREELRLTGERSAFFGRTLERWDVDGDGIPELLVGSPYSGRAARSAGRVQLFSVADGSELRSWDGFEDGDCFGTSLTTLDIDGDGLDELLVGAPQPMSETSGGAVFVFSGADGVLLDTLHGEAVGDEFGQSLRKVGDMDGDGISEIAVAAPGADGGGNDSGRVQVLSLAVTPPIELWRRDGDQSGDRLGQTLAAGEPRPVPGLDHDLDGDGLPDVVAGAAQAGGSGYVRAFSGADGTELFTLTGEKRGDSFGAALLWHHEE